MSSETKPRNQVQSTAVRAERIEACVRCLNKVFGVEFSCPAEGAVILSIAQKVMSESAKSANKISPKYIISPKLILAAGQAMGMLQALRPSFCEIAPDKIIKEMHGSHLEIEFNNVLELEATLLRLSQRRMFQEQLKDGTFDSIRESYERFKPNPAPAAKPGMRR